MSTILAAAKVGDTLLVRYAGGGQKPTRYKVRKINGKTAREIRLEGMRGAERWLVDGGSVIWHRDYAPSSTIKTGDAGHRRVISVEIAGRSVDSEVVRDRIAERQAAIARLPEGFDIGITSGGYVAMDGDVEVGPERANPWDAVVDAWAADWRSSDGLEREVLRGIRKALGQIDDELGDPDVGEELAGAFLAVSAVHCHRESLASDLANERARSAELRRSLDKAMAEMKRMRFTLRQIMEMAIGRAASNKPLSDYCPPEQVAALVGHALLIAAKSNSMPIDAIVGGGMAWAAKQTESAEWAVADFATGRQPGEAVAA